MFIFLLSFTGIFHVTAQKIESVSVALTTETISLPFSRYAPIHPGIEIGATVWNRERGKMMYEVNTYLGAYHHKKVENGFYLKVDFMPTLKIKNVIGLDFPVGVGYQHSFYPGKLYELDSGTGEFSEVNQMGKPHALVNFGFGLTYLKPNKIQPFIRHESVVDLPLYNGIANSRTFLKLGVNIKLNSNENK